MTLYGDSTVGYHLWSLAGLGQNGDRLEAAVTAGRIAAGSGKGAVFAPLAMGGAGGLRAGSAIAGLSGRTPPSLRAVLTDWPLVSAPMAEALTGASRAAVQRNLAWMEARGLIREVTGQGRFRMWRTMS